MNNYHIYSELSRTSTSTTYKGRLKRSLQYVTIKSLDKSRRQDILAEVSLLYALQHQNILKFFNWYETSNHIWLILEHLPGGSVEELLRVNKNGIGIKTTLQIGWDIINALQYLHSKSYLHNDLCPAVLALNEDGWCKLSEFNAACRIPEEAGETFKRVNSCYSAPELLDPAGIPSYASDIWSLGCLFYEFLTGTCAYPAPHPSHLPRLHSQPLDYSAIPPPFDSFISSCLHIRPECRIGWKEIKRHQIWCQHPDSALHMCELHATNPMFLPDLDFPPQPAWESKYKVHIAANNGNSNRSSGSFVSNTPTSKQSAAITPLSLQPSPIPHSHHIQTTPNTAAQYMHDINAIEKVLTDLTNLEDDENDSLEASHAAEDVHEHDDENYEEIEEEVEEEQLSQELNDFEQHTNQQSIHIPPLPTAAAQVHAAVPSTSKLQQKDMDFLSPIKSTAVSAASSNSLPLVSPRYTNQLSGTSNRPLPPTSLQQQQQQYIPAEDRDNELYEQEQEQMVARTSREDHPTTSTHSTKSRISSAPIRKSHTAIHRKTGSIDKEKEKDKDKKSTSKKPVYAKTDVITEQVAAPPSDIPSSLTQHLSALLFHELDHLVKPLVGNPKIEVFPVPKIVLDKQGLVKPLQLRGYSLLQILGLDHEQMQAFFTTLNRYIGGTHTNTDRMHALLYLQSLLSGTHATDAPNVSSLANILLQSDIMPTFISVLRLFKNKHVVQACITILALLIRHGTFIPPMLLQTSSLPSPSSVSNPPAPPSLLQLLSESLRTTTDIITRRRCMCCVGELLFYMCTQELYEAEAYAKAPSSTPQLSLSTFRIPLLTLKQVTRCLRQGEDEIVKHYAAKTIENILAQCPQASASFCDLDILLLLHEAMQNSRTLHFRITCLSAMTLMMRRDTSLLARAIDKITPQSVLDGLDSDHPRYQQCYLNFLNLLLLYQVPRIHVYAWKHKRMAKMIMRCLNVELLNVVDLSASPALHDSSSTRSTAGPNSSGPEQSQAIPSTSSLLYLLRLVLRAKTLCLVQLLMLPPTGVNANSSSPPSIIPYIPAFRFLAQLCTQENFLFVVDKMNSMEVANNVDEATPTPLQTHTYYLKQCIDQFLFSIPYWVDMLCSEITIQLQKLSRTNKHVSVEASKQFQDLLSSYPLLQRFLSSSSCRSQVFTTSFLTHLSHHIRYVEHVLLPNTTPTFKQTLLSIVEACGQHAYNIVDIDMQAIVPYLEALLSWMNNGPNQNNDTRFIALKVVCDTCNIVVHSSSLYDAKSGKIQIQAAQANTDGKPTFHFPTDNAFGAVSVSTQSFHRFLVFSLFPCVCSLFDALHPIPQYALKLLSVLCDANPMLVECMITVDPLICTKLFTFFNPSHQANSAHCVQIIAWIVAMGKKQENIYQLDVVAKIHAVLSSALDNNQSLYYQPLLDMMVSLFSVPSTSVDSSRRIQTTTQNNMRATYNQTLCSENWELLLVLLELGGNSGDDSRSVHHLSQGLTVHELHDNQHIVQSSINEEEINIRQTTAQILFYMYLHFPSLICQLFQESAHSASHAFSTTFQWCIAILTAHQTFEVQLDDNIITLLYGVREYILSFLYLLFDRSDSSVYLKPFLHATSSQHSDSFVASIHTCQRMAQAEMQSNTNSTPRQQVFNSVPKDILSDKKHMDVVRLSTIQITSKLLQILQPPNNKSTV